MKTALAAPCQPGADLIVVGDSQVGATWATSYLGNFLSDCLSGEFIIYGRGGTHLGSWLGAGGLDKIETMQRTRSNKHQNIGSLDQVPECKKRIAPILTAHAPKKVLFEFGSNYIGIGDTVITGHVKQLVAILDEQKISQERCFFLTPTYEMEVATNRAVPRKDLAAIKHVRDVIVSALNGRCSHIDGLELMRTSEFFDGDHLLRRLSVEGTSGCLGASRNDNAHVCGQAARDFANRVCAILNQGV